MACWEVQDTLVELVSKAPHQPLGGHAFKSVDLHREESNENEERQQSSTKQHQIFNLVEFKAVKKFGKGLATDRIVDDVFRQVEDKIKERKES